MSTNCSAIVDSLIFVNKTTPSVSYCKQLPVKTQGHHKINEISHFCLARSESAGKKITAFFAMKYFENLNFFLAGNWTILQRPF